MRTTELKYCALVVLTTTLMACDTGSRNSAKKKTTASPSTGSVNVLAPAVISTTTSSPAASGSSASGSAALASTAAGSTATIPSTPAPSGAAGSVAPTTSSASAGAAPVASVTGTAGAELWGTIPPDPTTGFNGLLYLVGERLVPGSIIEVAVNGTPIKFLPANFGSSELLSVYVSLSVPATYTFTAVAPDGTHSTGVTFVVPAGSPASLLGLNPPEVHMVFPPSLDTQFSGTVWLMGEEFQAGCVVLVEAGGLPIATVPLVYVNERLVGWVTATPMPGDLTLTVSNPTFLSSTPLTLSVGAATATAGAAPQVSLPTSVAAPFAGSVHIVGNGILQGATAELRANGSAMAQSTSLILVSTQEAMWTLVYPTPGTYEARIVNPGGAASPWTTFTVRQ